MPTNQVNNSNAKDFLDIDNLQGNTNGVNSTFGDIYEYIGKGSDIGTIFNSDPMVGKTLGYFSNKASIIDAIDSGINGGYNGFMSSVVGTFSGTSASMLVASLFPQLKGVKYLIKMGLAAYAGWEVGEFTKETFLNKEYRKLEFDPYDTQTHKFENGNWYEKSDNGSLTLIEDTNIIDNLNQSANESKDFNFYKNSTGDIVVKPKNSAFGEYYNIKTNGDIQTISNNELTVTTKQTDGVIRVETFSSAEDTKKLTSLTVSNPDGTYDYKNNVTGDWVKNSANEYIQTVKTSGADGLNIKQIIIDKSTGKAVIKTFDEDEWKTEEYDSSSEVNEYIKDGGKFEYVDENSSVISNPDGSKTVIHKSENSIEEKYVLDKEGNLESYEIKDENGEYQKYEGSSIDEMSEQEVQSISDALNDSTYSKSKIENAINNVDKSNLKEPTEVGVVSLKGGQTISHIAAKLDGINSIDLLEYNGLTLEQAKSLPIGFDVKIPKDVSIIQGEKAPIKIFENHDGTKSAIIKDENNNTIKVDNVEISSDKTQMSYTFEDATHILKKSSTGLMYESEVSTENITVQYDSPNIDGNKVVSNIDIKADTTFEEVSSLTQYTKEELREFNLFDDDTISAGSNISTPLSKDILDGGYGNITHYTTNDGENIFTVPNEDGSTRMIIANSDGYSFDSYGLEDKVDIEYERLGNDELIVKSLYAKEDLDIESFSLNSSLNKEQIAFLNSIDNSGGKILQGQSIILPEGKMQYVDSAYGKVIIQKTTDGNSIFIVPNSDVTSMTYGTFTDGFENQVYCKKEVA